MLTNYEIKKQANFFYIEQDYRSEEVSLLKATGRTDLEIDGIVPSTPYERRKRAEEEAKNQADEFLQMKKDIEVLKEEVKLLRGMLGAVKGKVQNESASEEAKG